MPERLHQATPRRLTTWLDCPRRYRFTYVDRPTPAKGPPWARNALGAAVHLALAAWWHLPLPLRTPPSAGDLLRRSWRVEGFRDDAQAYVWRERSTAMVEGYVAGLDPADEPRGIERTVGLVHGGAALSGRVDRIDERAGELVVVDYKTARHLLTTDDARASLALAVYAAAVQRTLRQPCHRVELHHLPSGSVLAWDHDDGSLRRHLDHAAAVAADCATAEKSYRDESNPEQVDALFPPRPSASCGWCDFRRHCAEGQRASPAREPWSGLDLDP